MIQSPPHLTPEACHAPHQKHATPLTRSTPHPSPEAHHAPHQNHTTPLTRTTPCPSSEARHAPHQKHATPLTRSTPRPSSEAHHAPHQKHTTPLTIGSCVLALTVHGEEGRAPGGRVLEVGHAHCPQPLDGFLYNGHLHEVLQLLHLWGRGRGGEGSRGGVEWGEG